MNEVKEPLKFKDDAEKNAALAVIQDQPGGARPEDFEEIDRISAAEVEEVEKTEEDTGLPKSEEEVKTLEEPEKKIEQEDDARKWEITEELISKYDDEEYTDENGRRRKLITQTNPDDFVKSYVSAERNNHHLKTIRIPQAQEEGYAKAKTEYEPKLQAMQRELDDLKAKPPEKKETAPVLKKPIQTETLNQYNAVVEELNGISDEDSVEHTAAMKKALGLSQKLREEDSTRHADDINNLRTEITSDVTNKLTAYETTQAENENKRVADAKLITDREEQQKTLANIYTEIDVFAEGKDTPKEFQSDQKFADMNVEATNFHNSLGEAYTGKTSSSYSPQDWTNIIQKAELDYINGTPALLDRAKSIGLNEPKNYQVWKRLDAIDAMRTGWIRNSSTNVWEQRFNSHTGKPVDLGDIKTAYNYYLDNSGLREQEASDKTRKEVDKVVDAVNKRDKSMVQLDESKLSQDGDGTSLTEEQAAEVLRTADMDWIKGEEMRGNLEPLNELNAALIRLKSEKQIAVTHQT